MSRGDLLVVDPSVGWPEDQGVDQVARTWSGRVHVWQPSLAPATEPRQPIDRFEGVVLLGSRASVHDRSPWMDRLADRLQPIVDGDVGRPFLGVCFGHQWLAFAAGGEIGFARDDRGKILGVQETAFVGGRLIEDGRSLRVIASHREIVTRIPRAFRVTARRSECSIDAIEHVERPLFGVQFHPEAREEFARRAGIPPERIDATVRDDSDRLLRAFAAIVESR